MSHYYILKKQIETLKNKYEPILSLDKLINNSIRYKTHYDVARVIYEIHKNKLKCIFKTILSIKK